MEIYNKMFERREKLLAKIKELQVDILQLPEGELHVYKDRGGYKWILSQKDRKGSVQAIYIPKDQEEEARKHAISTLLQVRLADAKKNLKATERFLRVYDPACRGIKDRKFSKEERLLSNAGFARLVEPYLSDNFTQIEQWKRETYPKGDDYFPQQLQYKVTDNLYVRSKSELMIANEYIRERIPFRYEMRVGDGFGSMVCDFVVLHPQTLQLYYHEHFGMMDKPEYARSTAEKIGKYAAMGIYLGVDLIVTGETQQHPLSPEDVRRMIKHYFT